MIERPPNKYAVKLVRGPFVRLPPHPLAIDDLKDLPQVAKRVERPLAADLFCGAGGLSLGLSAAGFEVVLGADHDEDALETHRAYHPGLSANLDLADPDVVEQIGEALAAIKVDLVAGGPPCQPFSRAGRSGMRDLVRRGVRPSHDMRRELWQSFLRVVAIAKPRAVLMENVPDMALDRDMWILRTLVDELEQLGYGVDGRVLSAGDYGVPQFRHRLFVVAIQGNGHFSWPDPEPALVTLRNAIGDLPPVEGGWRPSNGDDPDDPVASGWARYGGPTGTFQVQMRMSVPPERAARVYDHITRPVREDDALAFEVMDSGTRYSDLPEELQRYRSDIFDDKYKRLDWNSLSRTIVAHIAKDGYWYIHPGQHRTLTVREAARLQTFQDHVRFAGPPTAAFRQIGNAVPPVLGTHLAAAIARSLGAGNVRRYSTGAIATRLAAWFDDRESLVQPWLKARSRWQVVLAELLLARLAAKEVRLGWKLIESQVTPGDTKRSLELLELGLRSIGREQRLTGVAEAIDWCESHPEALAENAPASAINAIPGVSPAIADLAIRVLPGPAEDRDEPVLATQPVLRLASRFFGSSVQQNRNQHSDGRLAVARLIGGDDSSHSAHLALMELAASHCSVNKPACGRCPLAEDCDFSSRQR